MMRELYSSGLCLVILLLAMAAPSFAQPPADSLNGKTIYVYLPSEDWDALWLEHGNRAMTKVGKFMYSITVTGADLYQQDFFFRTLEYRMKLSKTGFSDDEGTRFKVADFQGRDTMWIIIDPSGPISAPPKILFEPPRRIHILNPWPFTAPSITLNGKQKSMFTTDGHCGWFSTFVLDSGSVTAVFSEVLGNQTYGAGGFDDSTPWDLTPEFTAKGPDIWIEPDTKKVTAVHPGIDGVCGYQMAATVRDFSKEHPDFDHNSPGDRLNKGMVKETIGPDRKPVASGKTDPLFNRFDEWWRTDSTNANPALRSYETCVDIPVTKASDGMWEYDTHKVPQKGWFPVDDFVNPNNQTKSTCYNVPNTGQWITNHGQHNMDFCMETHATFIYKKGQVFSFRGDDDVWVFINDKLVIDLGGIHVPKEDSVLLDNLGLVEGQEYKWDFFYCERQPCGSSLRIKTSIYFKQQRGLYHEPLPQVGGVSRYKIRKTVGGTGSCGSVADSVRVTDPEQLVYVLLREDGTKVQDLGEGSFLGGITITTPHVEVDPANLTGLDPGTYIIQFWEPANAKVKDQVSFTVAAPPRVVDLQPPYAVDTLIGTTVPVVAQTMERGQPSATAESYTPRIPPGLLVYLDEAKTQPVTDLMQLSTGADGKDTLWVTGDPAALADKTHELGIAGSGPKVKLTFRLPPLDLPLVIAAVMYDDDANGVGDRLVAQYDRDISTVPPKRISYSWPSGASPVPLAQGELGALLQEGTRLVIGGREFSSGVNTVGPGVFASTYPARSMDSTQQVPIADGITPIILGAEIRLGSTEDTLYISFSEAIAVNQVTQPPGMLFLYQVSGNDTPVPIDPKGLVWLENNTKAVLIFDNSAPVLPRSGDRVRMADGPQGLLADASGNLPGPDSRYRVIMGQKRTEIETVTKKVVDPWLNLGQPAILPTHQRLSAEVEQVVEETGRMGHLIKVDLADYVIQDDFNTLDPSQVALDYQVMYYSNLGEFVNESRGIITCTDALFSGNCTANRGYIFLGWNVTDHQGAKVGTGAYVAKLSYALKVEGRVVEPGTHIQKWGVIRSR